MRETGHRMEPESTGGRSYTEPRAPKHQPWRISPRQEENRREILILMEFKQETTQRSLQ